MSELVIEDLIDVSNEVKRLLRVAAIELGKLDEFIAQELKP